MIDLFFKLLGVPAEQVDRITKSQLRFRGDISPAWIILAALILGALTFWMYRRSARDISPAKKYILATLRSVFLLLILVLLLRPVWSFVIEGSVRRELAFLVDTSTSMKVEDPRPDPDDLKRVAIAKGALDPAKGLKQDFDQATGPQFDKRPRLEVYKAALKSDKIDLLPRLAKDYNLEAFRFDETLYDIPAASYRQASASAPAQQRSLMQQYPWLVPVILWLAGGGLIAAGIAASANWAKFGGIGVAIVGVIVLIVSLVSNKPDPEIAQTPTQNTVLNKDWIDKLEAKGGLTSVGDAVRQVVARKRGQPMAGIIMVTDGSNNSGSDPRSAAHLAKEARVPLFIYGVGIEKPRNLIVGNIFAPEVSFVKDEVPVTVRVRSSGVNEARVQLMLVSPDGSQEKVDEKQVNFDADPEPAISLKVAPKIKGEYTLRAVVEPADGTVVELTKEDNQADQPLRVIDSKIKVLLVEQAPRWEFKYLMALLMRDRRVDVKIVLMDGSQGLSRTPNSPYLEKLPEDKKELFKYDLIILGDVDPKLIAPQQLEAIDEFVTKFGGGLAIIAGKKNNPWGYRKTPLEKMLPVELDAGISLGSNVGPGGEEINDKPIKMELTASGKRTPMLRLSVDERESDSLWAKLPPVFWVAPVARAKPAAEVLLVDPSPSRSSRYGKMPVVAVQQYGMGQVMFIGTDNTWRWRKNKGDEQYVTLWGQVVQRLALPHLLGASKRTQLTFDKKEYVTNEKVNVYARLYTEAYAPITQEKVKAYVTDAGVDDPRAREVILRALPDQPGMYRGEFTAPEKAGQWKLYVELDKSTLADLVLNEPKIEPGDNALNVDLLDAMARTTGGRFVREEDLHSLPGTIKAEAPVIKSNLEVEFWTSPLYYGLMLLVVTIEWVMRKMVQLK